MPTSEARILANRANSLKSTGPSTPEGKAISRRNGLKHGLAGAGVVLPEHDAAQVEARDAEFQAEMAPRSAMGKFLARQMAALSVRVEHAQAQQTAAVATRVRNAVEAFDHGRLDEADRLLGSIGEDPRGIVRRLRRTPEGVERLILAWQDLRADLTLEINPTWADWHRERAAHLMGHRVDEPGASRIGALSKAASGDFSKLGESEGAEGDRRAWARDRLLERIDEELAGLAAHYESLDFETIELDRAQAPERALFDPSKEAALARRYEGEATRGFFKALKEFRAVEAEAEVKAKAAEAEAALVRKYGVLASSRDRVGPSYPRTTSVAPPAPMPAFEAPRRAGSAVEGAARPIESRAEIGVG